MNGVWVVICSRHAWLMHNTRHSGSSQLLHHTNYICLLRDHVSMLLFLLVGCCRSGRQCVSLNGDSMLNQYAVTYYNHSNQLSVLPTCVGRNDGTLAGLTSPLGVRGIINQLFIIDRDNNSMLIHSYLKLQSLRIRNLISTKNDSRSQWLVI